MQHVSSDAADQGEREAAGFKVAMQDVWHEAIAHALVWRRRQSESTEARRSRLEHETRRVAAA